jgi:integrase
MARYQHGYIFEAHGAFHVRFCVTGDGQRIQKSQKLCSKDPGHASLTCKAVQQLAAAVMSRVNAESGTVSEADIPIAEFWQTVYLPHLERNAKASTLHGYKKIWESHLSAEFTGVRLKEYQTHHATQFLTRLAERGLGTRTIAHVRSLASGMFRHALRLNRIVANPWRDAGSLSPAREAEATHAYTLEEAEAISNALFSIPQAQLVFCLAAFLGLRPGEISALRWEDVDQNWIHIRRAAWNGIVGTTKTEESVASIPLIEPVRSMLNAWRARSAGEWVFPNGFGRPLEMTGFAKRIIAPVLRKRGIAWHGLYAGRRAAATLLVQLTGNAVAAQYVLRHKNLATTTAFYVKPVQAAALEGMKLVESALSNRRALGAALNT